MITTLAADMQTRWMQASEELDMAQKRFTWICYSSEPIVPADTALAIMQEVPASTTLSSSHLQYFNAQVQEKKDMLKIERSRYFPELSVGYALQKISPMSGLSSWMVKVSFPVNILPQRSRTKQANISWQTAQWEASDNQRQLNNKVHELQSMLSQQYKRLAYYRDAAINEAMPLEHSALMKLNENETGIYEFIQSLNTARSIRQGYIETVYNYNVTSIELELYTE